MLRKGCHGYLACVVSIELLQSKLEELPIVSECVDVFLEDLASLSSNREIEFSIDLVPNTTPIYKAPLYNGTVGVEGVTNSVTGVARQRFY